MAKAYRDWFVHDILPEPGKECEMDHPILQDESEVDAWINTLNSKDQEVLRAWKAFSENVQSGAS
jgi:hypothetical protein